MRGTLFTICTGLVVLAATPSHAALIEITFQGIVSSVFAYDEHGTPYPSVIAASGVDVGDTVTGTFLYDTALDFDALPGDPNIGVYNQTVQSASLLVGNLDASWTAAPGNSVTIYDDMPAPNYDHFFGRTSAPTGAPALGGSLLLDLSWLSSDLSTLSSDALVPLPEGATWTNGLFQYSEWDGVVAFGFNATPTSAVVTAVPEPTTALLLLAGLTGLGSAGSRRRSR